MGKTEWTAICAAVVLLLGFLLYMFVIRDTWEKDNCSQIAQRCEAVLLAIEQSDDDAAAQAYAELNRFIGERTIEREWLAKRLDEVRRASVLADQRIEQARRKREARELVERQQREAEARAERQRRIAEERVERQERKEREAAATRQSEKKYKGFTEAELQRVYEKLKRKGYSAEEAILTVKAMLDYPDTKAKLRKWLDNN